GDAYAIRNLLWEVPGIKAILAQLGFDQLATDALGFPAYPISATMFDKTSGANWIVPAHQDLIMPVECRVDEPGFTGWKTKLGVAYVEPPTEVLSRLVALRAHLDDCPATNGALEVVPGSHQKGKLQDGDILAIDSTLFSVCSAALGDVLLMSPLIVHRSTASKTPVHRRVLHLVYACEQPGVGVRWKCV
ncbi:MAG: phytanoyl-CoA dioxygenase, partial [Planctomycetaceae bacterium]